MLIRRFLCIMMCIVSTLFIISCTTLSETSVIDLLKANHFEVNQINEEQLEAFKTIWAEYHISAIYEFHHKTEDESGIIYQVVQSEQVSFYEAIDLKVYQSGDMRFVYFIQDYVIEVSHGIDALFLSLFKAEDIKQGNFLYEQKILNTVQDHPVVDELLSIGGFIEGRYYGQDAQTHVNMPVTQLIYIASYDARISWFIVIYVFEDEDIALNHLSEVNTAFSGVTVVALQYHNMVFQIYPSGGKHLIRRVFEPKTIEVSTFFNVHMGFPEVEEDPS